jgi:type II secretory ATPase GspE/PulE/Tfp pilus assembly ATPase PilB-like protein
MISNGKDSALGEIKPSNEYNIYKANEIGCDKCHAGYKGRMGIFEAIRIDNTIADILSEEKNITRQAVVF